MTPMGAVGVIETLVMLVIETLIWLLMASISVGTPMNQVLTIPWDVWIVHVHIVTLARIINIAMSIKRTVTVRATSVWRPTSRPSVDGRSTA